jgi:hypothetical protein
MNLIYRIFKVSFFLFLDISGILLGIFLTSLGVAFMSGWSAPNWMGWALLVIGIGAFFLHLGHYFNLRYMRWLFGDQYFLRK